MTASSSYSFQDLQSRRPDPHARKPSGSTSIVLVPTSTYFCLIVSFEHVADTLLAGCMVLNQTSKVTWIVTVVDQFVNVLGLTLEDAGTDQRIPLLAFPRLGFTPQSRGGNTKPDLPGTGLLFGGLATEPPHLCHDPGQHRHGGERMYRQGAHQLQAEVHRGFVRKRMLPRCECDWLHLGKDLETQQNVATVFCLRTSNLFYVLLGQNPAPLLAQSPGPGRGAQVLGGGVGPAWAGGALIVPGWLRSSAAGGREGSPPLGSRLFFTPLRTRRVPRPRQQQARRRGGCGGGGGGGGGVCARLAFPPPRLGERGGGEGRAEAGISQLGPQGPKRGTRCSFPPHCAL